VPIPNLMIVIASTRPGRGGTAVAEWFIDRARGHGGFELDIADLVVLQLPFLDEPNHPRLRQYTQPHTFAWSERVDAADAFVFVFVTPEYNYGYPATLKNAIDFLHQEWQYKPVGFVAYGGVAAGTRSLQQLTQVVSALRMTSIGPAVTLPFFTQFIGEDGAVHANEVMEHSARAVLDELLRVQETLRPLRSPAAAEA